MTVRFINRPYLIRGAEMQPFLQGLREAALKEPKNRFEDESGLTEEDFLTVCPVSKEQFLDLFSFCDPVVEDHLRGQFHRHITKKDLIAFLFKFRHGLSDELLKVILNYPSRQCVSLNIAKVRQSLMLRFVPENIGFNHSQREDYINFQVSEFVDILYNENPEMPKALVFVDGTYFYVQKKIQTSGLYVRHTVDTKGVTKSSQH